MKQSEEKGFGKGNWIVEQVYQTIIKHKMIKPNYLVLVALSGGPDSLCLLHILLRLQERLSIKIAAAHLDHGLRGEESAQEAAWVKELCQQWGVPCTFGYWDGQKQMKKGLSPEDCARRARLKFLLETQKKTGANLIAQGHHADDQAETLLIRLLNGAGTGGLGGIKPVRGVFIRPLIKISREEILSYCQKESLNPRFDSSNQSNIYLRNQIRLELIPLLKRYNPNLAQTLGRTAEILQSEDQFLDNLAKERLNLIKINNNKFKASSYISLDLFNNLSPVLARRVLRLWAGQDLDYASIERVRDLASKSNVGKIAELTGHRIVKKGYNYLELINQEKDFFNQSTTEKVCYQMSTILLPMEAKEHLTKKAEMTEVYCLPWKKNTSLPVLRKRQPGDWLQLSYGRKKLKDWFIDQKIPKEQREEMQIIALGQQVLWIPGLLRAQSPYKGENIKVYLCIRLKKSMRV